MAELTSTWLMRVALFALEALVTLASACGVSGGSLPGGAVLPDANAPDDVPSVPKEPLACSPGTYVASSSATERVCSACPSGHFSAEPNAPRCEPWRDCAPGTFVSRDRLRHGRSRLHAMC
jgi:hypothetical protein